MLKSQVIDLDRDVKIQNIDISTAYEKKRLNEILRQLWMAIDQADRRLNLRYFQFHGHPIPPEKITTSTSIIEEIRSVSKEKDTNTYQDIKNDSLNLELPGQSVILRELENSQVVITGVSSVHIETAVKSVVYILCDGPVFVHGMENCIVIAQSHQLRLHNMKFCSVFAMVHSGRVIIEHCNELQFGGFDSDSQTLRGATFDIDDFNWPTKMTPSPHYSRLDLSYQWHLPLVDQEWGQRVWSQLRTDTWLHDL